MQKKRRSGDLDDECSEIVFAAVSKLKREGKENMASVIEYMLNKPETVDHFLEIMKKPLTNNKFTPLKALGLSISLKLSKWQYITLRETAIREGVCDLYPSYYQVQKEKKECYPPQNCITVTDFSARISLQALLDITIKRIMKSLPDGLEGKKMILISKWGCDGASSQSRYKQKLDSPQDDSSIFMTSLVPLKITLEGDTVWENSKPCAAAYCRPVHFKFIKESEAVVKEEVTRMNEEIAALHPTMFESNTVEHQLLMTMVDAKICTYLSEAKSNAACYICLAKPTEMNDLKQVGNKKTSADMLDFGLSSLHARINLMECLLHVSYRLDTKKWSVKGKAEQELKDTRKKIIQDRFKTELGLLIDVVKQGHGTTNDGNTARRFFEDPVKTAAITGLDAELSHRHEDIRDVMLTLAHRIRISEDKLERHELRERSLGEQVKKMLGNLDKKHRALEPLKGMISRLDERLSNVETILLQKEEREKASQAKINEVLGNIQQTLITLIPAPKVTTELDNSLTVNSDLQRRLDATDAKIDAVNKEIRNLKNGLNPDALRTICLDAAADMNPFEKHISEAEKLLNKYELKLNEYNGSASAVQTDFVPLNEVAAADEAWHSKMSEVIERQEHEIKKIQRLLSDAESMWKDLPRLADLHRSTNQSLEAISTATETMLKNTTMLTTKVETKVREMGDKLSMTNQDIQRSLTQSNTMTEQAFDSILKSYDSLHAEVRLLSKSDEIIQAISDNVLATKKRLEYVVAQIIMQLADTIKGQHKYANKAADIKLDGLQLAITNNQTLGLHNLSSTLDLEMSQVWRQIGVMHQKIMTSQLALNKLSENTEKYVNSSTTAMNTVEKEVSGINEKMIDLKENMNYVLGELSVVTQKFQIMTTELGKTLNNFNNNKPATDAPTIADAGPGPHNIGNETSLK